jgi:hypothetical protein
MNLHFRYSVNNTSIMGPDELMNFLKQEQKVNSEKNSEINYKILNKILIF